MPSDLPSSAAVPHPTLSASITTRDELIDALHAMAELEHAVMCQYLFAAFSMKRHASEGGVNWMQLERMREWQATILLVARQEMEHLGSVCNLLTAIGGTPHFERPRFPHLSSVCPNAGRLTLAPFGLEAIARFMEIERGHSVTDGDGSAASRGSVGSAYRGILNGFERLAEASSFLFIGPTDIQVVNATIDLRPRQYDMDLRSVHDLETVRQVIDQIMESSDAPPDQNPDSHYMRFKRVHDELRAMQADDPAFEPARPVAINPVTDPDLDGDSTVTYIDHQVTRKAADLFDDAYETMLLMLMRFYIPGGESSLERSGIKRIVFFPMMTSVLRPLGEVLTRMPAHHGSTDFSAGPTFEIRSNLSLAPNKEIAWMRLHERLERLSALSTKLLDDLDDDADWCNAVRARVAFLDENLSLMAGNFAQYMNMSDLRRRIVLERLLNSG